MPRVQISLHHPRSGYVLAAAGVPLEEGLLVVDLQGELLDEVRRLVLLHSFGVDQHPAARDELKLGCFQAGADILT